MTVTTQDATGEPKLSAIRSWLLEANPEAGSIELDTDLFASGLLTSIQFVELVLLVEELTEREVAVDDNAVDKFRTLRAIASNYLG
ncbi:MAG: phosphopantetheine-binding protein [Kiloniellales bacterium]